jgi:hypothetical protein
MTGRPIRWAFTGVSAASLLACVFVGMLWLDALRVHQDSADFTAGHTYVWGTSDREGVSVWVIRGWPWPVRLRVRSAADADEVEHYTIGPWREDWNRPIGKNGAISSGLVVAWVGSDGTPPRVSARWNPTSPLSPSAPMPARVVSNAPHWALIVLTGLLPATWLMLRQRRRMLLRRRRRLGLCLHCGYDLKGNVSGVCTECGVAAAAKEAA